MKSSIKAILSAFLMLTTLAPGQQLNPGLPPCCKCIDMTINAPTSKAGSTTPTFYFDEKTGTVDVSVTVTEASNAPSDCEAPSGKIIARQVNGSGLKEMSYNGYETKKFSFTREDIADGSEWIFELYCSGATEPCKEKRFDLKNKGCSSCTQTCPPDTQQGSFTVSIPVPAAAGGSSSGLITFFTPDFSFPGRDGLYVNVSPSYIVTKGDGKLTKIETGNDILSVSDITGEQAFKIEYRLSSAPTAVPYRTITISRVLVEGSPRLRMDTTFDGATTRHEQYETTAGTTVLEKGRVVAGEFESLTRETLTKNTSAPGVEIKRSKTEERRSASDAWQTTSDTETTWENQLQGWVTTKQVIDPDGEALTSTWTYYQPGEPTGPVNSIEGLGKLKRYVRYDGYESFHTYALHYESVATPYAGQANAQVTTTTYDPGTNTTTEITTINGIQTSRSVIQKVTTATESYEIADVYTSQTQKLTTITHYKFQGTDFILRPIRTIHPDGTLTTYSYTRHTNGGYTTVTENGSSTNGTSVSRGMRTTTTVNSRGTTILSQTQAIGYGTGAAIFQSMAVTSVDTVGRPLVTAYFPESATVSGEVAAATNPSWTTTKEYNCCGVSKQTDQYGIVTYYAYDHLQRQIKSNTMGVTTENHHNGLTTEIHRYAESVSASLSSTLQGSSATLISKSVRNLTGTLQESWTPDPSSTTNGTLIKSTTTATIFKPATGLSSRTVMTTVDNYTQTSDSYLDGRTAATYGALSPAMQYAYSVNATGEVRSQSYVDGTTLKETTTTQSDWVGRTLSMTYMDNAVTTMEYNSLGQMVKSTDPDGVTTLMGYNEEGEQVINAADLNNNGVIDYGVDTVRSTESDPSVDNANNPVIKSISKVWQPGDTSPIGGTIISNSLQTPNGLASASQSIGLADPSTSVTTLSGNGNWITTSVAPDGTKSVITYTAGRMVSMAKLDTTNAVIESQSQGYDSLNRPATSTHSRTGTSTTTYLSETADIVASVADPDNRTTAFVYDVRGRQISVNAPDTLDFNGSTLTNVTTITYNPDNTVAETNGDQTYRVSHTYDYADRQISMTTYGTETATTTWQYSPDRGFLTRKQYSDGEGTNYTYTAAGRLATRTWARGVTTTYSYDNGGRMTSTNYSDSTPDIAITYDALGRKTSESSLVSSVSRSSVYYSYNTGTLQIDAETVTYDFNTDNTVDFARVIDRSQDALGRESGWQLKTGTTVENSVAYGFSTLHGRLTSVTGPNNDAHIYGYLPNSDLISTVTNTSNVVTNVWEANRNVLLSKENKVGSTVVSKYEYSVNNFGQRTNVSQTGSAFAASRAIAWGYNSKGEIVKADHSETAQSRAYQYDGIGNRLKSADSLTLPSANNYTPNALNQYSEIGSVTPSYDDDGNATAYPLPANLAANSTLVWDGENRLIQAQVAGGATVSYVYDSQSRRIAETVGSSTTAYIYDGWNPIAEYSVSSLSAPSSTLTKSYTWGMDLSGSTQGAGGVGGLLAVSDGSGTYYATYDGNGNVSEYLDSTGSIVAHYEYDPFGKTTVSGGLKASDFAHRFSTKPSDSTTGLYYYGYRWYDPETGRWPSRDPIGERGGINLYGFLGNSPLGRIDVLGMEPDYWQQITVSANGDEREWFEKHFPNIVKRAKELTKASIRGKMQLEVCRQGSVGIAWGGGTELAVKAINNSRDKALPETAEWRAKNSLLIFDSDLGDEPQSWWHAFAKLGSFTFRAPIQAILINSQIDVPDDVENDGKDCSYFSYSFVMEARDALGLPGLEVGGTRASWILEDTIKCCKHDCPIAGGKFYWVPINSDEE